MEKEKGEEGKKGEKEKEMNLLWCRKAVFLPSLTMTLAHNLLT